MKESTERLWKGENERNERLWEGKMGEMKESEKENGRNERLREGKWEKWATLKIEYGRNERLWEGEMGKRKAFVKEKWKTLKRKMVEQASRDVTLAQVVLSPLITLI